MEQSVLVSISGAEFKSFLRETLKEILVEVKEKASGQFPDILSIAEAAAFLKFRKSTLYEKTAAKLIPHFKRGNKLLFKRTELEKWLEEGKVKTRKELEAEAVTYTTQRRR